VIEECQHTVVGVEARVRRLKKDGGQIRGEGKAALQKRLQSGWGNDLSHKGEWVFPGSRRERRAL